MERNFLGTKRPGNETSKICVSFLGTKSPVTMMMMRSIRGVAAVALYAKATQLQKFGELKFGELKRNYAQRIR